MSKLKGSSTWPVAARAIALAGIAGLAMQLIQAIGVFSLVPILHIYTVTFESASSSGRTSFEEDYAVPREGIWRIKCERVDVAAGMVAKDAEPDLLTITCELATTQSGAGNWIGFYFPANGKWVDLHIEAVGPGYEVRPLITFAALIAPCAVLALLLLVNFDYRTELLALRQLSARAALFVPMPWLIGFSLLNLVLAASTFIGWTPADLEEPLVAMTYGNSIPFAAYALLAAVPEELLLRGWLYKRLQGQLRPWLIAVLTAELFVLLHLGPASAYPHPGAFLAGIFGLSIGLSWLRVRYGSVSLCVAAHVLNNLIALSLLRASFAS